MTQPKFAMNSALLFSLVLVATPVSAASINGRWVLSGYACSQDGDVMMSIAPDTWSGNDWSCSVEKRKDGKFSRSCQVDDETSSDVVSATVSGDTLTITGEDGTVTTSTRCPER